MLGAGVSGRAGVRGRGAQACAGLAVGVRRMRGRRGVSGTVAATRPALAATRPGQGPRYGHCACTWACLGAQLASWVPMRLTQFFDSGFDSVLF